MNSTMGSNAPSKEFLATFGKEPGFSEIKEWSKWVARSEGWLARGDTGIKEYKARLANCLTREGHNEERIEELENIIKKLQDRETTPILSSGKLTITHVLAEDTKTLLLKFAGHVAITQKDKDNDKI